MLVPGISHGFALVPAWLPARLQITHIFQMSRMGYNLMVHPFGFIVHRPHPPSAGYNKTFTGPAYSQGHKPTEVGSTPLLGAGHCSLRASGQGSAGCCGWVKGGRWRGWPV